MKAPRSELPNLSKRDECLKTGVYLLIGDDPNDPFRKLVYVGESDKVKDRLTQHDKDDEKEFFRYAYVIISKDENLTKAHVRYLESRILHIIKNSKRSELKNKTIPVFDSLPESEIADMERFLEEVRVLLPVLGFDVLPSETGAHFEKINEAVDKPNFKITFSDDGQSVISRAREIEDEFVVLKGSFAKQTIAPSLPEATKKSRQKLIEDGDLVVYLENKFYQFTRDVPFTSPSAAAGVVSGISISGPASWKNESDGQTYKEWRANQFEISASK